MDLIINILKWIATGLCGFTVLFIIIAAFTVLPMIAVNTFIILSLAGLFGALLEWIFKRRD